MGRKILTHLSYRTNHYNLHDDSGRHKLSTAIHLARYALPEIVTGLIASFRGEADGNWQPSERPQITNTGHRRSGRQPPGGLSNAVREAHPTVPV